MKFKNIMLTSALIAAVTVSATGCAANTGYTRTRTTTDGVTNNINRMFYDDRVAYDNNGVVNRQTRVANPNVNTTRNTRYTSPNYSAAAPYSTARNITTPSQRAVGIANNTTGRSNINITDTNNVTNVPNSMSRVATDIAPAAVRNNAVTNNSAVVTRNRDSVIRNDAVTNRPATSRALTNRSATNRAVTNRTVTNRATTNRAIAARNNIAVNNPTINNTDVNNQALNNNVVNNRVLNNNNLVNNRALSNNNIVNNRTLNNRAINNTTTSRIASNNRTVNNKLSTAIVNGHKPGPFTTYTNERSISSYDNSGLIGSINPATTYSRSTNVNNLMRTSITPDNVISSDRNLIVPSNNVSTNPADRFSTLGGSITSAR